MSDTLTECYQAPEADGQTDGHCAVLNVPLGKVA